MRKLKKKTSFVSHYILDLVRALDIASYMLYERLINFTTN